MIRKTGFWGCGAERKGGAVGFGLKFIVSPVPKCEGPGAPSRINEKPVAKATFIADLHSGA
jgi:hypothetical protein